MVDVVQLVEHRIVVPSVVGSSPIIHPQAPQKPFWLSGAFLPVAHPNGGEESFRRVILIFT